MSSPRRAHQPSRDRGHWCRFRIRGRPELLPLDDRARYYINIDNTGDGNYDVRYRFDFRTKFNNRNFLHSLTQVTSLDDPQLFQKESYEVVRETYNRRGRRTSARSLGRRFRVAPSNVGPKTMPDYETLANSAIRSLPGGGRVFAGQRDDTVLPALDRVFDSVTCKGRNRNMGGGIDTLAGYGVQTTVLQVPEANLTRDRKAVRTDRLNAVVGVWGPRSASACRVTNTDRAQLARNVAATGCKSPVANPLVNELFVSQTLKDKYNRTRRPAT